jgi:hypothetical protein
MSVHETRAAIASPSSARCSPPRARALARSTWRVPTWVSQRLLDRGAHQVLGIDIRAENIRRAELIRDHFGIDPRRRTSETRDVFDVEPRRLENFDIVLRLGLIDHLENPVDALRIAWTLTRGVCVVESQLHEHAEPIAHGRGGIGEFIERPTSCVACFEEPGLRAHHPIAPAGGVVSLIPSRGARLQALGAGRVLQRHRAVSRADAEPPVRGGSSSCCRGVAPSQRTRSWPRPPDRVRRRR